MENKLTAVEWLVNELNQKIDFIPMDKWDMIRDIVQQAKAMEKEQITDAYDYGYTEGWHMEEHGLNQYYIETYGAKTNSN
jgi:hypothetical protein